MVTKFGNQKITKDLCMGFHALGMGGGHQNVTRGGEQLDVIATQSICNTFKKFVLTPKDFQGAKTQFNSTC